jgi:hypothetical protein
VSTLQLIGAVASAVGALAAVALVIVKYYFSNQKKKEQVANEAQSHIDSGDTSSIVADLDKLNRL